MVNNEWDDILYWENYAPCREMLQELERKYGGDPANYECWHREHYDFISRQSRTKKSLSGVSGITSFTESHIGLRASSDHE